MHPLTPSAFALVAVVCFASSASPPGEDDRPPTFAAEAGRHFDAWDADRDGRLTAPELDRRVNDRTVTGPEAAALAVLKRIQRSNKYGHPEPDRAMLERFIRGERLADDLASTDDEEDGAIPAASLPDVERAFTTALARIRRESRGLFEDGGPMLHALRQGPLGDCFLLAPIGAAVARDPAAVRAWFGPRDDDSFVVAFPGGRSVRVAPLTDCELALTSWSGGGVWLSALEKAYAMLLGEAQVAAEPPASVTDAIATGGRSASVLRLLTDAPVRVIPLREKAALGPRPSALHLAERLPALRDALEEAFGRRSLVCCSTGREREVPGLTPNHAYAVLAYDATADSVTVWNPHGNTFRPRGPPGLAHGYPTRDGRFTLPLAEFAQAFSRVQLELPRAPPDPPPSRAIPSSHAPRR